MRDLYWIVFRLVELFFSLFLPRLSPHLQRHTQCLYLLKDAVRRRRGAIRPPTNLPTSRGRTSGRESTPATAWMSLFYYDQICPEGHAAISDPHACDSHTVWQLLSIRTMSSRSKNEGTPCQMKWLCIFTPMTLLIILLLFTANLYFYLLF